jgi:hypothetical protein
MGTVIMSENQPVQGANDATDPTDPPTTPCEPDAYDEDASSGGPRRPGWRRWGRRLLYVAAAVVALLALSVLNNNVAWWPTSRGTFVSDLDNGFLRASEWVILRADSPDLLNPALLYMLDDIAKLSEYRSLQLLVEQYDKRLGSSPWRRLTDSSAEVQGLTQSEWAALDDYQRWFLYAIAPAQCTLSEQDRADMFAADKHRRGSLTHQLLAVLLYRKRVGPSAELDALVDRLCERIAGEAVWDVRVTDLYLQRIAFLLAGGRPDLVRRRWVERVMSNQEEDGGWVASWYGMGPRILEFSVRGKRTNAHTTVQGLWIYAMLKHRYPAWIDKNYSP